MLRPATPEKRRGRRVASVRPDLHDDAQYCLAWGAPPPPPRKKDERHMSKTMQHSVDFFRAHDPSYVGTDPVERNVLRPLSRIREAIGNPDYLAPSKPDDGVTPQLVRPRGLLWGWQKRETALACDAASKVERKAHEAVAAAQRRKRLAERMRASADKRIERMLRQRGGTSHTVSDEAYRLAAEEAAAAKAEAAASVRRNRPHSPLKRPPHPKPIPLAVADDPTEVPHPPRMSIELPGDRTDAAAEAARPKPKRPHTARPTSRASLAHVLRRIDELKANRVQS